MGQEPNVQIEPQELPRPTPQPGPTTRWRSDKPGIPHSPAEVPAGGYFGMTGPDPGWALRIVSDADIPDDDWRLRSVLTGLMLARSASLGRAPVIQDLHAALLMCGYGEGLPEELAERRERWLDATHHDIRPGETAVAEVDRDLLIQPIGRIAAALRGDRA